MAAGSFLIPFVGLVEWVRTPERYALDWQFHGRRPEMAADVRGGGTVWTRFGKLIFVVR